MLWKRKKTARKALDRLIARRTAGVNLSDEQILLTVALLSTIRHPEPRWIFTEVGLSRVEDRSRIVEIRRRVLSGQNASTMDAFDVMEDAWTFWYGIPDRARAEAGIAVELLDPYEVWDCGGIFDAYPAELNRSEICAGRKTQHVLDLQRMELTDLDDLFGCTNFRIGKLE